MTSYAVIAGCTNGTEKVDKYGTHVHSDSLLGSSALVKYAALDHNSRKRTYAGQPSGLQGCIDHYTAADNMPLRYLQQATQAKLSIYLDNSWRRQCQLYG